MRRIIFGFFLLLVFLSCSAIFAQDNEFVYEIEPQFVRVGISDNSFSNYLFDKISLTSDEKFTVTDGSTFEKVFNGGETVNINYKSSVFEITSENSDKVKSNKKIYIIPSYGSTTAINGLKRKSKQALYSGNIELEISKKFPESKFAIVNVLPLQSYLKGVVPNEMPVSFGLEALKAQAVLARNYVLKPREQYYKEFDICDSVACQVYYGANTQEALSDKAVEETKNIVALYDNELILAVYSSTAGGYTESYKNVFMQNMQGRIMSVNIPYLVGVPDINEMEKINTEEKMRAFYSSSPKTFDNMSPYFRWSVQWTKEDLKQTLIKTLRTVKNTGFVHSKYPVNYDSSDYLGKIKDIYINKRGDSGKIVALTIITDKNEFTIYKELIIRKVFIYNNKILPSANVFFDIKDDMVYATGGGLGHGVGMSQWGAGAMAKEGYKFKDIIHHYYKNVNIAVLPISVTVNKPVSRDFYAENKKAKLIIENKLHFSELNIIINNRYINEDTKKTLLEKGSVDISHYLKKGRNVITYDIKDNKEVKNRQLKSVKFIIESED